MVRYDVLDVVANDISARFSVRDVPLAVEVYRYLVISAGAGSPDDYVSVAVSGSDAIEHASPR